MEMDFNDIQVTQTAYLLFCNDMFWWKGNKGMKSGRKGKEAMVDIWKEYER